MAIPKLVQRQRDFSAGEIDPLGARRDDTKIIRAGLARARNVRPTETGALVRRPGRAHRYFEVGRPDIFRPVGGVEFDVIFLEGHFRAYLRGTTTALDVSGCPWTWDNVYEMTWAMVGRFIIVAHQDFQTQVIEYTTAGTFTRYAFAFRAGLDSTVRVPFFRFQSYGVTMVPSDRSGTIDIQFSDDVLDAGHVNTIFRWLGRQLAITAVTDAQNGTAFVLEQLPPTYELTVGGTDGFALGEVVSGTISGAEGEVVAIDSGGPTITVAITNNFTGFDTVSGEEKLVSPNGTATPVTGQAEVDPLPALTWDEQFISTFRGWPGSVSYGFQRLTFADFPQLPQAIAWSAINAVDDFKVTADAASAILEYIPQQCRVLHVLLAADIFVLTDAGIFYIPVSAAQPLAAGSIEFRIIYPEGAANVLPALLPDGLAYVGRERARIYALQATGQTARPYLVIPITDYHEHLFTNVTSLAVSGGDATVPGRYLYAVNDDGRMMVARYDATNDVVGWFPWEGQGAVTAVASRFGHVIAQVNYVINSIAFNTVEEVNDDCVMDCTITLTDLPLPITLPLLAGLTFSFRADGFYLGELDIDDDGHPVGLPSGWDTLECGLNFSPDIQPIIGDADSGQDVGQRLRKRRVSRVSLVMRDSQQFEADGNVFASYRTGEDMGVPMPLRNKTYFYRPLGRSHDPTIRISQAVPGAFHLVELTLEVTV